MAMLLRAKKLDSSLTFEESPLMLNWRTLKESVGAVGGGGGGGGGVGGAGAVVVVLGGLLVQFRQMKESE